MKVDAYRFRRKAGCFGDLECAHALHQSQHERFAISLRKALNDPQNTQRVDRYLRPRMRVDDLFILYRDVVMSFIHGIDSTCDRGNPRSELLRIAQLPELSKCDQEALLR